MAAASDRRSFRCIIKLTAIAGSFFLSGNISSLSLVTIPALLSTSPPTLLLHQWKSIYERGSVRGPAMATVIALMYGCVATTKSRTKKRGTAIWIAGLATAAIVPYTLAFMGSVNGELMGAADGVLQLRDGEVREAVGRWSSLNGFRGMLPFMGGLVGMWSLLEDL